MACVLQYTFRLFVRETRPTRGTEHDVSNASFFLLVKAEEMKIA
jgi:hypothetical protein